MQGNALLVDLERFFVELVVVADGDFGDLRAVEVVQAVDEVLHLLRLRLRLRLRLGGGCG